jgi:hypothetical protein
MYHDNEFTSLMEVLGFDVSHGTFPTCEPRKPPPAMIRSLTLAVEIQNKGSNCTLIGLIGRESLILLFRPSIWSPSRELAHIFPANEASRPGACASERSVAHCTFLPSDILRVFHENRVPSVPLAPFTPRQRHPPHPPISSCSKGK